MAKTNRTEPADPRDHMMIGFHAFELWTRSGAWSHFPCRDSESVDPFLLLRVSRDDALRLQGILRELLAWATTVKFEEIPGARERIAARDSELSELLDARGDTAFQKILDNITPRDTRKTRGA